MGAAELSVFARRASQLVSGSTFPVLVFGAVLACFLLLGNPPLQLAPSGSQTWRLPWQVTAGNTSASAPRASLLAKAEPRFYKLILDKLEPFRNESITQADLAAAFELPVNSMYRVLIYENKLYVQTKPSFKPGIDQEPLDWNMKMFLHLLCRYKVPDVEFVLNYGDGPLASRAQQKLPVFSWVSSIEHFDIFVPFPQTFRTLPPFPTPSPAFDPISWETRDPKAVWRGATTGGRYTKDAWNTTIRSRLVAMCLERRDLCDARFTRIIHADAEAEKAIRENFGVLNEMPIEVQADTYKYMVMVDGNGPPSARAVEALRAGILLLWQETEQKEFFYTALEPYRHYVPLARRLEDLYSTILWVRQHPLLSKAIIQNAQSFAERYFNTQFSNAYLHDLLVEYAKLLNYTPSLSSEYTRVNVSSLTAQEIQRHVGECSV